MKITLKLGLLTILTQFIFTGQLRAQAQSGTGSPDSIVQITAEAEGLSPVDPTTLPPFASCYWTVYPNGGPVPLPCPPLNLSVPIYEIVDGVYLVDLTGGTVSASGSQSDAVNAQGNLVANLIEQTQATQMTSTASFSATAMDSSSVPIPGGTNTDGGGYGDYSLTNYSLSNFNTNLLWLQITNVLSGTVYANLQNATNQVYAIWSTPDLTIPFPGWLVETEAFSTAATTNTLPFTVPILGRQNLFLRAQDWTGVYTNGLPCWWTWYYFHTLALSWSDVDAYGVTLGDDYTNQWDPNVINFAITVTNTDVNAANLNVPLSIFGGTPAYVALLVNDANTADAIWTAYSGPSVSALLGADGFYNLSVGLRGFPTNATETWETVEITKDTIFPQLTITNPIASTVTQMPIRFQGFASEALNALTLDVSNATGTILNQSVGLIGQFFDTNLMRFTTNYFQSDDVYLAGGTNVVTFHATDWAGNETNVSLILNYPASAALPALSLTSPLNGTTVGSGQFTLRAHVNNPALAISATVGSTTVSGVVEPNGTVWVQNLPLVPGTNNVTITANDGNGHLSSTNFTVVENNLGLGVNPLSLDNHALNQTIADVSGTIGSPSLAVFVNGVPALNYGDGTWEALGVPVNPVGTAIFSVQVSNSTAVIAAQDFYQIQPPLVQLMSYIGHQYFIDTTPAPYNQPTFSDAINWFYQTGGAWLDSDLHETDLSSATNGAGFFSDAPWNTGYGSLPWENAAINVWLTNAFTVFQSQTQTRTMIIPSGMEQAGTTNVYLVMARACEFSDNSVQSGSLGYGQTYAVYANGYGNAINPYLPYGGDLGLPPQWLKINDKALVNTGVTNVESSSYGGASISSVWGATVIAAPAGQNWEASPTATQVYKNKDYTFFEQVSNLTLQIIDANTHQNLSAQPTNTVIVGQPINLMCQLSISNSFMTNFVLTNFSWTVPGYAVTNFYVSTDAFQTNGYPVLLSKTNNQNVSFWWADSATNRTVQCSGTLNGLPVTGVATFNIVRPKAQITAQTTSVELGWEINNRWWGICFGTNGGMPGILFSNFVTMPSGEDYNHGDTNFETRWIQTITNYLLFVVTTPDGTNHVTQSSNSILDTAYPYAPTTRQTEDSPSLGQSADIESSGGASQNSTMWLMFRPHNGNWVPLRMVNWIWGGTVSLSGTNLVLTSRFWSTNPPDADTGSRYPIWMDNVANTNTLSWDPPF